MNVSPIIRNYLGLNALNYEMLRTRNPKWKFEHESLLDVLATVKSDVTSIMDAPVGTGRFLKTYRKAVRQARICCFDYSEDMLRIASKRAGFIHRRSCTFQKLDLLNEALPVKADLSVCYRFLNLVEWKNAEQALSSIFRATGKYAVFSIRTIDSDYHGERYIEGKIHLHCRDDVLRTLSENGFAVHTEYRFHDARSGQYAVFFCERVDRCLSSRINHNARSIYVYGGTNAAGKLYQTHNEVHSTFIFNVTQLSPRKDIFPKIKGVQGDFIDAEWIDGETLSPADVAHLVDLLVSVQSIPCDADSGFDYVGDIVIPRFYRAHPLMGKDFCDSIVTLIRTGAEKHACKVSHPDIIPGNVLRTPTGHVIIDNELLCYSRHYLIDILNLMRNIDIDLRSSALERYLKLSDIPPSEIAAEHHYLSALWLAREAGAILVKTGDPSSALHLASLYRQGTNILPVDLRCSGQKASR